MRILVSGATATLRTLCYQYPQQLGVLMTPQNGNRMCSLPLPWACDNAAFSKPDDHKFWRMCMNAWSLMEHAPPLWVAAPDVVGQHTATRRLFDDWVRCYEAEIGYVPFRLAFVLQNGCTVAEVPWDQIAAVFVGGDDRFKLRQAPDLIAEAKSRGKLVHVGRVNSQRRLLYCLDVGADSVDGTSFSMFPDRWIPMAVKYIRAMQRTQLFAF